MDEPSAHPSRPITVLLVDDDPIVRSLCRHILERAGYDVHEAADGPEAIVVFTQRGPIDLVISDIHMPGNGRTLAAHVASQSPRPAVVFMSGFDLDAAGDLTSLGPLLRKPFTGDQLLRAVRLVLAGNPQS